MTTINPVLQAAGLTRPGAARTARAFDYVVTIIGLFLIIGAFHLHFMLLAGDWDFWVDWKDRRFWVTLTPVVAITFPAAAHYFFWTFFRLPIGATFCILALFIGTWVARVLGFHWWVGFPYSLIMPATLLPLALVLDGTLYLTRNWLLTAIIGAWAFGLLFYAAQWPWLAAYRLPVEHMGEMMSVGDLIGYSYIRSATPEYLRFVERGTLRTFGGHSAMISAFFSAFLCMLTYIVWWFIGKAFSTIRYVPNGLKGYMGLGIKARSGTSESPQTP
jgi:methane/ammonia monooxygenase subunit A